MRKVVLIGCGNMGSAIAARLDDVELSIIETKSSIEKLKLKFPNASFYDAANDFDATDMVVILAVKPQKMDSVKIVGISETVLSIMAGVELARLKNSFKAKAYARAMPNLAAEYGLSATALVGDEKAHHNALSIFNKIGKTVWLHSEKELDAATALAGSGPAFLALIAEAIMDGGVRLGLSRSASKELTEALFGGFSKLIEHEHPALLKDRVMSPGGTTAAGYAHLEDNAVRSAYIGALKAAFDRAQELK
jgi:pyrroline-5-carboxylate reductase